MKFYDKQGCYSYKDTKHIKHLLICALTHLYCGGWVSPYQYILDNNIEYDIAKERSYYGNGYISIYCRIKQKKKNKSLFSNNEIQLVDDKKRIRRWIIIKKAYLVKLGFDKILDENETYY